MRLKQDNVFLFHDSFPGAKEGLGMRLDSTVTYIKKESSFSRLEDRY